MATPLAPPPPPPLAVGDVLDDGVPEEEGGRADGAQHPEEGVGVGHPGAAVGVLVLVEDPPGGHCRLFFFFFSFFASAAADQ